MRTGKAALDPAVDRFHALQENDEDDERLGPRSDPVVEPCDWKAQYQTQGGHLRAQQQFVALQRGGQDAGQAGERGVDDRRVGADLGRLFEVRIPQLGGEVLCRCADDGSHRSPGAA